MPLSAYLVALFCGKKCCCRDAFLSPYACLRLALFCANGVFRYDDDTRHVRRHAMPFYHAALMMPSAIISPTPENAIAARSRFRADDAARQTSDASVATLRSAATSLRLRCRRYAPSSPAVATAFTAVYARR